MNSKFKMFLACICLYLSVVLFASNAYFDVQGNIFWLVTSGAVIAFLTFCVNTLSVLFQASPRLDLKEFIKNTWLGAVQAGVVILLLTSLVINVFLWDNLQDKNTISTSTGGVQSSTVPSSGSASSVTDDATAVFTFMQQLCIQMRQGDYQQIFTNDTTSGYQQDNNALTARENLVFASEGGITQCDSPTKDHIVFSLPLHTIINCVLHLQTGTGNNFAHKYYLIRLDNGQWKIGSDGSASDIETQADPQCADKVSS